MLQDALLLALISGGIVYCAMLLASRRLAAKARALEQSEQRFRGLTELSADWFWETDAAHRVTWLSGGAPVATFFGGTPTYGKRFWEIPRVEVDPLALEAHRGRLEQQLPFFDLVIARADERGARQIHIISGRSRHAPDGRFLGYHGVGRDVTEQRHAERALLDAKERLELALGGGSLAEWDYDLESDEMFLGGGWTAFLGGAPAVSVSHGAQLVELIHPEDRPAVMKSFRQALKDEAPAYSAVHRMRTAGGGWKWLHSSGRVT